MKTYTIVAGVNGCGKSSLTGVLRTEIDNLGKIIDVDKITASCGGNLLEGGKKAVALIDECLEKEIAAALEQEAAAIRKASRGVMIAMCIEGKQMSSEAFAKLLTEEIPMRDSAVTFVIGSSFGLAESVKREAFRRLSMSEMT